MRYQIRIKIALFLICLGISTLIGAGIYLTNPLYFQSFYLNENPDAVDYGKIASNLSNNGSFSRTKPNEPDALRTPGYPILLLCLNAVNYPLILYIAQSVMLACSALIVGGIAENIFGHRAAVPATLIMALDISLHSLTWQGMSEISSLFLFLLSLYLLNWPRSDRLLGKFPIVCGMSGLLCGLATITRPSFLIAPLFIFAGYLLRSPLSSSLLPRRRQVGNMLIYIVLMMILPVFWIARNYNTFGIVQLSPVGNHNLVYFVGAGAYQVKFGVDRFKAQEMISHEYSIPSYNQVQNPYFENAPSISQMQSELKQMRVQLLLKYPVYLAIAEAIGISKGLLSHSLPQFGHLFGLEWIPPSFSRLLQADPKAVESLLRNSPLLIGLFAYQMLFTLFIASTSLVASFFLIRHRGLPLTLSLYLMILFGIVIIALFGVDAVYRSRVVAMPFIAILSSFVFTMSGNKISGSLEPSSSL